MTPTRRTRKTAKQHVIENQSSDEDSSDSGSVTRCVCGESHNVGLMVQCDKCEVWQHCECVGLEEKQIPDHYYCDYCQPAYHHLLNAKPGRPKRQYDATTTAAAAAAMNGVVEKDSDNLTWTNTVPGSNSDVDAERQPKRRKKTPPVTINDVNKSETSSILTDFSGGSITTTDTTVSTITTTITPIATIDTSAASTVSSSLSSINVTNHTFPMTTSNHEKVSQPIPSPPTTTTTTERRSRRTKLPADNMREGSQEDEIEEAPKKKISNCVVCNKRTPNNNCSCHSENNNSIIAAAAAAAAKRVSKAQSNNSHHSHSQQSNNINNSNINNNNNNPLITKTTHSKSNNHSTSSPSTSSSSANNMTVDDINSPYWNEQGKPTRESSPPAKVRYPHSKMSFADMNKRAKQIMELVSKMQSDLVVIKQQPTPPLQVTLDDVIKDRLSTATSSSSSSSSSSNSSLSSASTVPIMDECALLKNCVEPLTPLPFQHEETCLEILDRVNRDLVKFQRKFGSIHTGSTTVLHSTAATTTTTITKSQRLASKR